MADRRTDAFATLGVGVLSAVLMALFMGTIALWGRDAGGRTRARAQSGDSIATRGAGVETNETGGAFAAGSIDASNFVPADSPARGVPVLCYHYLRGRADPVRLLKIVGAVVLSLPLLDDTEIWTQSRGAFENQMAWLHENGYQTIDMDELGAWQRGELTPVGKPVVITFDDGDRSVYTHAYPVLKRYGFKATFFIITSQVGRRWEGLDNLSWAELRELHDSGVFNIETHTHDMHFKVETDDGWTPVLEAASSGGYAFPDAPSWQDIVAADLDASRAAIADEIGWDSRYIAWPYGGRTASLDSLALAVGFERGCTLFAGSNTPFADPDGSVGHFLVRRFTITARTSLRTFKKMIEGRYVPPNPS